MTHPKADSSGEKFEQVGSGPSSFEHFYVLDPAVPAEKSEIRGLLYGKRRGRLDPGRRIFDLMFPENDVYCRTVLLETGYIDEDYLLSYSRFYYLSHFPIPKYCERMHFFSSRLDFDDLFELSDSNKQSYLGFTVLRPTPVNVIGRTIIRPPEREPNSLYVTCAESYAVNLAGNSITATGAVFQQQDAQVGVCASTAVLMVTRHMSKRFGMQYRTTTEISELASQYDSFLGRGIPSRGLSTSQIGKVLSSIGYDVIIYGEESKPRDLMDAVYKTVESEIPVIMTFDILEGQSKGASHAIAVVGHQWKREEEIEWEPREADVEIDGKVQKRQYYTTGSLIGSFVTMDDARGPYRTLRFDTSAPELVYCEDSGGGDMPCRLKSVVIPLPRGIWLSGEQAERKAFSLLLAGARASGDVIRLPQDIVLRTYLRASNRIKDESLDSQKKVPAGVRWRVRGTQMPKYVWVTEVSNRELAQKGLKLGELLIDPSSSPWAYDFLAFHVEGRWVFGDPTRSVPIDGWLGPYPVLSRPTLEDLHVAQFK